MKINNYDQIFRIVINDKSYLSHEVIKIENLDIFLKFIIVHLKVLMSSIKIMPHSLLDKCIGENLWIIMKSKREFAGILRGFDDFFNMVL